MTNNDENDDYWLRPQRRMAMITGAMSVTTIIVATTSGFGPSGKQLLASAPAAINNDIWLRPQWQTMTITARTAQARTITMITTQTGAETAITMRARTSVTMRGAENERKWCESERSKRYNAATSMIQRTRQRQNRGW